MHPSDHQPGRIIKADQNFAKNLGFRDIKLPVKVTDIQKSEKKKKRIPSALVFLVMKIRKNVQSMYQKNVVKKAF